MMWQDVVNASFEVGAGLAVVANTLQLARDRIVKGTHWAAFAFFTVWGYWNVYYYPHLDQWLSLVGGVLVALLNTFFFGLLLYFSRGPGAT